MNAIIEFWNGHGTKVLGAAQGIVAGFITIQGLIPPAHVPYWSAVSVVLGVLTVQRGFTNSRTQ